MKLSISCGAYDRTWPLIAGLIAPEGIEFDWHIMPPEAAFVQGQVEGRFDLTEMSTSTYLLQLSRGDNPYKAIPVFLSRAFRHSAIFVRTGAGITDPSQLKGRPFGVSEYQLTANLWARGILSDEYGVRAEDVDWVQGGLNDDEAGREDKVDLGLSDNINLRHIPKDDSLWAMMARDELDAIMGPRAPHAFHEGDNRIKRLFDDVKGAEQAYFKKTGLFPIMHLLGIKHKLIEQHPELPRLLFDAFEQARQHAERELNMIAYNYVMLPWVVAHMAETRAVMGDDFWPYGIEKNRKVLEAMCRYSYEQGMAKTHFTVEDLFASLD